MYPDLQDAGKVMHLATSTDHVALACSNGEVRLYAAASLELVGMLPALPGSVAADTSSTQHSSTSCSSPVACTFSPEGLSLTVSYSGGQLIHWDLRQPSITHQQQFHRWVFILFMLLEICWQSGGWPNAGATAVWLELS